MTIRALLSISLRNPKVKRRLTKYKAIHALLRHEVLQEPFVSKSERKRLDSDAARKGQR